MNSGHFLKRQVTGLTLKVCWCYSNLSTVLELVWSTDASHKLRKVKEEIKSNNSYYQLAQIQVLSRQSKSLKSRLLCSIRAVLMFTWLCSQWEGYRKRLSWLWLVNTTITSVMSLRLCFLIGSSQCGGFLYSSSFSFLITFSERLQRAPASVLIDIEPESFLIRWGWAQWWIYKTVDCWFALGLVSTTHRNPAGHDSCFLWQSYKKTDCLYQQTEEKEWRRMRRVSAAQIITSS